VPVWLASVCRGIAAYFVQDIETSYYPDDEAVRRAVLASYREEFQYMTISGWNRDRLGELRLSAELVPPGIDLETFRPLAGAERRGDLLLALGRSHPLKNLTPTVDAWRLLGADGARPELCLFGIEPELGARHGVRYVLRPSDAEVNALFNRCAVFIQTSRHEGFALPPLEAMATGAATILAGPSRMGTLVTAADVGRYRALNFGRRAMTTPIDVASVTAELARYDPADAAEVCRMIRDTASLELAAAQFVRIAEEAIADAEPVDVAREYAATAAYLSGLEAQPLHRIRGLQRRIESVPVIGRVASWIARRLMRG
jgi:glycosyltransferase involved in cell wall biosynthesis